MSETGRVPGEVPAPSVRVVRRRLNLNATVHQDTLARLDELTAKFATSRGKILDKVVLVLHAAYKNQKVLCIHGSICVAGRTDLPEIY